MARGRMIDKRICLSNKFADLKSDKHRLLYLMIYPHLDVEGRFSSDLRDIKDECVRKLRFSFSMIANALVDLHFVGLLRLYEANKKLFLEYCKFHEFQKINRKREGKSKYPKRQEDTATGLLQWCNTTVKEYKINIIKYNEVNKEEIQKKKEISFNFKERKFINITIEDKAGWLDAYPACDIDQELSKMREWLLGNPAKRKKNYRRFITNWLSRAQDKGGTRIEYKASQVGKYSGKHKDKYPSNFLHRVYGVLNKQKKDQNKYADIIFSLSDEEAKVAVEKFNKSPADFIKFLEEDFKIKLKGDQDG